MQYAILESNGKLSVFTYDENKDKISAPISFNGRDTNLQLKTYKEDGKWLMAELSELGYQQLNEIF